MSKEQGINLLAEDLDYIIIENEVTKEKIAEITQKDVNSAENYVIRIKYK